MSPLLIPIIAAAQFSSGLVLIVYLAIFIAGPLDWGPVVVGDHDYGC